MITGFERPAVAAGAVLCITGLVGAETLIPTGSDRSTGATITANCEGTTSVTDSAVLFDPFQSLSDLVQECDAGATHVRAASIQQSQIYTQGFLGWATTFAEGDSPTPFTAEASSAIELAFDVPEPSRVIVYAIFDIIFAPGAPGSLSAEVELTTGGGAPVIDAGLMGIGVLESETFFESELIEAGPYVFRASATAGTTAPTTGLPQGEVANSHWFEVLRQGDTNSDERIDVDDLVNIVLAWGPCPPDFPCYADVNNDGFVSIDDLVYAVTRWDP